MKKILIFVLLAVVAWLVWERTSLPRNVKVIAPAVAAASPNPTPIPTPEEQVAAVLNKPLIPAGDLVEIFDRYPALAESMIKGRKINVAGKVKHVGIFEMDDSSAEVTLEGTARRSIIFRSDLGRNDSLTRRREEKNSKKWILADGQLFLLDKRTNERGLFCQEGEQGTMSGTFERSNPGNIRFQID